MNASVIKMNDAQKTGEATYLENTTSIQADSCLTRKKNKREI